MSAEGDSGKGKSGKADAGSKEKKSSGSSSSSSSSSSSGGAFAVAVKWITLICCLVMAVVLLINILSSVYNIGGFVHTAFYIIWMLVQALVDFGLESLDAGITKYAGFLKHHIFRGSMMIVVSMVYCFQYWNGGWYDILLNIASILMLACGIVNIVFGAIAMCGKK